MNILLTGATGFLGRHLLRHFIRKNYQVLITLRSPCQDTWLESPNIQTWRLDQSDISNIFSEHPNIDAIIHAATDYGHYYTIPTQTFWSNEYFPMQLLEHALLHKIPKFVNTDTFFNTDNTNYDYLKSYTLSKRHFQEWGKHCSESKKIAFINFKLFHLYGTHDNPNKFVPGLIRRCLAGEAIDLTDGNQLRDFIHIDDVVSAMQIIIERDFEFGYHAFDVGTGQAVTIREVAEIINDYCDNRAVLNFGALSRRSGEPEIACADIKMLNTLGWVPLTSVKKGLLDVITAFAKEGFVQ